MLAPNPVAGVDVGKSFLDLGFEPAGRALRVRNDPAGIAALVEALRRRGATRVALEAIGPYAWPLTARLAAEGFDVGLADPRQVRAFRTMRALAMVTRPWEASRPSAGRDKAWARRVSSMATSLDRACAGGSRAPSALYAGC